MKKRAKKSYAVMKRRSRTPSLRWGIVALLLLAGVILFTSTSLGSVVTAKVKSWMADKHERLASTTKPSKVKVLAQNKTEEASPIHFEFYTTLPNMQMGTPKPQTEKASNDDDL